MCLENYCKLFQISIEKLFNTLNKLSDLRAFQDTKELVISERQRFLSMMLSLAQTKSHQFN